MKTLNNTKIICTLIVVLGFLHISCADANDTWKPLQKGDTIQLIAPSSMIFEDALPIIVQKLEENGLKPIYNEKLNAPELGPYYSFYVNTKAKKSLYSNTDEFKMQDFQRALNSDSKAIWVLRGGLGFEKIMAAIDRGEIKFPKSPKLIIGFSDLTGLHLYYSKMGWKSLHAVVAMFAEDTKHITKDSVNSKAKLQDVIDVIMGKVNKLQYNIIPLNAHAKNIASPITNTTITGGNLRIIADNFATSTNLNGNEKIIFIEGNYYFPQVEERTFMQFIRSNAFEGAKALVLGSQNVKVDWKFSEEMQKIVLERLCAMLEENGVEIPVFHSQNFGHTEQNFPLPLGFNSSITKLEDGSYTLNIDLGQ